MGLPAVTVSDTFYFRIFPREGKIRRDRFGNAEHPKSARQLEEGIGLLSDNELIKVQEFSERLVAPVKLLVHDTSPQGVYGSQWTGIAAQISGVSMNKILFEEWDISLFPGKPSITLEAGGRRNIHYFAAPAGRELDPFLQVVSWLGAAEEPPQLPPSLNTKTIEAQVLLLIAPMCPHCPQAVRNVLSVIVSLPHVSVAVVDVTEFGDIAEQYNVKSTPTAIINGGSTIVGAVSREEFAQKLAEASEGESLTEIIDSMVKSGRAENAAALICEKNAPEIILPILTSKEFSRRIGALFAMEEALKLNQRIFDPIVEDLTPLLFQDEAPLRGDTAELLGKIGNPAAIPALEKAGSDPDPDVREAVEEALELLRKVNVH
jgi:hypothetical protein